MRQGHPERLKAFDYIGFHRYFLTFCTFERRDIFKDRAAVRLVHTQLLRAGVELSFAVSAYCFMPNHVHILVDGMNESSDGRRFITLFKQLSGFHYQHMFRARLWQRYGYERVLRDDEDTRTVCKYILENPVRAGLCCDPREYAFSGSDYFSIEEIWNGRRRGAVVDLQFRLKPEPTQQSQFPG